MSWIPGWLYRREKIYGRDSTTLYMDRRIFLNRIRYHVFHRGDEDEEPHDHPFNFVTFPLNNYVERVYDPYVDAWTERVVNRFSLHWRPAEFAHRVLGLYSGYIHVDIESTAAPFVWKHGVKSGLIRTIVFTSRQRRRWGFWSRDPNTGDPMWLHWKDFYKRAR